ncbi:MAG: sulfate adenylyltransferase subunit CysN [Methanoculleaceae archaeon]
MEQNQRIDLLRFATAGSVDNGKSTLIGRLLFDSKSIFEDQLLSIRDYSRSHRNQDIDYALVTDGLKSEREQGITIDVAYRFFATPKRRFIIADTPGHEQYTRNMATGASNASLSLILIDATQGVTTQTRRHTFISTLLGIRHLLVAVNKMDLVDYSEEVFDEIVADYTTFSDKLSAESIYFIPISALHGDNVIDRSPNMPWYQGSPLLDYLETVTVAGGRNLIDFRFPVQYVNWGGGGFRGYCGTIASGVIRRGERVRVLPSGRTTTVSRIVTYDGDRDYAFAPMAVTLCLTDDIDISRGDLIARENNYPTIAGTLEANLVWMDSETLRIGRDYLIKQTTRTVRGIFNEVRYIFDPDTLHRTPAGSLHTNEIGKVRIELKNPIYADHYSRNRVTGSFIVIDPVTHQTAAAGMITALKQVSPDRSCAAVHADVYAYPAGERVTAQTRYDQLCMQGAHCIYVDDEILRQGLCRGLSIDDPEYARRLEEMIDIVQKSGVSVVVCTACRDAPSH